MTTERKRAGSLTIDEAAYFMTDYVGPAKDRQRLNSNGSSVMEGMPFASTRNMEHSKSITSFFESSWAKIFASKSLEVNQEIAATYKFVETLSESPRGTTSLAIDTRNSLRVAVRKVKAVKAKIGPSLFRSSKSKKKAAADQREEERRLREQFCNEVEILKDLRDSPYIIKYMRTVVLSETPLEVWLVTEWCEGNSVASVLKNRGSLSLKESIAVISCVLLALQEMREYQYIHGNLNPKTVLLSHAGVAKLSSLSLSHRLDDYTSVKIPLRKVKENYHADAQVGFAYLAPETLAEGRYSFASDIWSAGVLLLEMFTGCQPYGRNGYEFVKEKVDQLDVAEGLIEKLEVFAQPYDGENDSFFHAVLVDILRVEPKRRPSVDALVKHTMFAKSTQEFKSLSKTGFIPRQQNEDGSSSASSNSVSIIQSLVFDGIL